MFRQGPALFNINNIKKSTMPDTAAIPCACALVEIILQLNDEARKAFQKVVEQLMLPDSWEYIEQHIMPERILAEWVRTVLIYCSIVQNQPSLAPPGILFFFCIP